MMLKVLIFAIAIAAVIARPQPDNDELPRPKVQVNGQLYEQFPGNGVYEENKVYFHYKHLCEFKSVAGTPTGFNCVPVVIENSTNALHD